jgi:hypothetical protein
MFSFCGQSCGQEPVHDRDDLRFVREQREMAAATDDVDGAVTQQPGHEAGVDERDDRVVVAGDQQDRLPQAEQVMPTSSSTPHRRDPSGSSPVDVE